MAPAKTMAVSQQQLQQQSQQTTHQQQTSGRPSQADQASSKSKKKKGKQQQAIPQQSVIVSPIERAQQQVSNGKLVASSKSEKSDQSEQSKDVKRLLIETSQQQALKPTTLTPNERTSIKKPLQQQQQQQQHQYNQKPSSLSPVKDSTVSVAIKKDTKTFDSGRQGTQTVLAKQISTDEPDDIDAGIEVDGSSNSGSSVKDINEDQIKSTSVSPVMAQSNIVNEQRDKTKHAIEVAPIGQLTGSLCQDIAPRSKKTGFTTKQQLAANQQVIDADEQLLQQKLQNKQRKPSLEQGSNTRSQTSLNTTAATTNTTTTTTTTSTNANLLGAVTINTSATSTQNTANTPQSPALCKICEQHVYQMERMMAEKSVYHRSCFRCYQCKIQLRIDNYSSHEGQVYCKAHHRQIFQPQVKLDNEDDVDIVAKSTSKVVDDYLLQRGRLSDLSFSFLQPKPQEIQKRQMIICENEPAELPKDVVRSDTKVDDGMDRFNLNLNNILEKFERGNGGEESQPSSAGVNIEKPSFNLKKTLMAFETKSLNSNEDEDETKVALKTERPVVKKLTNLDGFLNRQNSGESDASNSSAGASTKPLAVRRSESLMLRLRKYESRIAGEQIVDDESDDDENNNSNSKNARENIVPKKLSSLKSQWENGDILKRRSIDDDEDVDGLARASSDDHKGNSPAAEKNEELLRIRQQLARKRSGGSSSSIKNIYENAIKVAQQAPAAKLNSSDLSALNGFSTSEIQQQLLQHNGSHDNHRQQSDSTPSTPNKDHFQLNLNKKANKLRERFEQGLINNNSHDDSDGDQDGDNERNMSKLDQIRQEKLEDLSVFTEGEIKAREARTMFQQIDRRLSAASGQGLSLPPNSRSLATISASMQAKLQSQRNGSVTDNGAGSRPGENMTATSNNHLDKCEPSTEKQKPIRLMNNIRT